MQGITGEGVIVGIVDDGQLDYSIHDMSLHTTMPMSVTLDIHCTSKASDM